MRIDRPYLKQLARRDVAAARPSARLVTLVYLLLTVFLTSIVQNAVGSPFQTYASLVGQGYDPQWAFFTVFSGGALPIAVFVSLRLALYSAVMGFGYTAYCVRLSRGQAAGYGTLLEGFSMVGRVILTRILVAVFTFLWALLLMIPLVIVGGLCVAFMGGFGMLVFIVLYIAYFVAVIAIYLRYALVDYCLLDDPEGGSMAAISCSKELMRGRKGEFFVLLLSFLGWLLLVALLGAVGGAIGAAIGGMSGSAVVSGTVGIVVGELVALPLSLWVNPYMNCTVAHYYNAITGRPDSGYDGYNGYGSSSGPGGYDQPGGRPGSGAPQDEDPWNRDPWDRPGEGNGRYPRL